MSSPSKKVLSIGLPSKVHLVSLACLKQWWNPRLMIRTYNIVQRLNSPPLGDRTAGIFNASPPLAHSTLAFVRGPRAGMYPGPLRMSNAYKLGEQCWPTMHMEEVAKALSSETRLNILRILAEGEASAVHVYKLYNERFEDRRERATIYRELEMLYKCCFLVKSYNEGRKEIVYRLAARSINIDLIGQTISAGP
jgi:DNA-binding transcriptional ArsR family regulator